MRLGEGLPYLLAGYALAAVWLLAVLAWVGDGEDERW